MSLKDQSRSPGLLSTTALATVERAINTALRSDPASADRLALHAGRLLAIEVTLPPLAIYALIVEDGVELYHRSDANADVTVKGNPMDLAALLLNWNTRPGVIGGPVDISGNRELLQEMQQLADYVGNESGLTPGRRDVYEFGQDVDELRMDVDRLDARIQRLRAARAGVNSNGSATD